MQNLASIQQRTILIKFAHVAEKSEKGSISNLSTKALTPRPTMFALSLPSGLSQSAAVPKYPPNEATLATEDLTKAAVLVPGVPRSAVAASELKRFLGRRRAR